MSKKSVSLAEFLKKHDSSDFTDVENTPTAYYLWPDTGSKYVSYVYCVKKSDLSVTEETIGSDNYDDTFCTGTNPYISFEEFCEEALG